MKVNAVVVTYNRIELLRLAIERLENQYYSLNKIVIVDNKSTDGTIEYLKSLDDSIFDIVFMDKNVGGAGGFYHGIKRAYELTCDYIWIMDDDTICEPDALANLINAVNILGEDKFGFISSNVLFKDGHACMMNIPTPVYVWNEYVKEGLIQVSHTSFVAMFIPSRVVKEVGLPIKEYFIWGDDGDYSRRIARNYPCYLYAKSTVYHYMKENIGVDIFNTEKERIGRFFFFYRNNFASFKREGFVATLRFLVFTDILMIKIIFSKTPYKLKKLHTINKGLWHGLFMRYKIDYLE